jgi:hypothetical protein
VNPKETKGSTASVELCVGVINGVADFPTGGIVSVMVILAIGIEAGVGELHLARSMLQITIRIMVLPITIGEKSLGLLFMKSYHSIKNQSVEFAINSYYQV